MYQINFQHPVHVHFIGIGGISMSGLAEILLKENFTISGSDSKTSSLTEHLSSLGATIFYGQKEENIVDGIDVVVYTAAVRQDNEELQAAANKGLPLLSRAELLGQLMKNYKTPIAISGTHGKTTTTSMMSHVLLEAQQDPTISVGGILKAIGGNIRVGSSEVFVTEACEYTNSFLHFLPKIAVILNIDADHLDFFKDLDDIRNSFRRFAQLLPSGGSLVINKDIEHLDDIISSLECNVVTYSLHETADYRAENISHNDMGNASFDVLKNDIVYLHIDLSVNGEHNISNALSVIAVADILNLPLESIQKGLHSFTGTNRRFEYKGECCGFTIVDDYAHHPTEIAATLKAAANYPHRELWCVFQPHTYTRTKTLFYEFADALSHADHVILTDIYAARETDTLGVSSKQLADVLKSKGCDVHYISEFSEIRNFCLKHCAKSDLLITMGAGDVVNIGEGLLEK